MPWGNATAYASSPCENKSYAFEISSTVVSIPVAITDPWHADLPVTVEQEEAPWKPVVVVAVELCRRVARVVTPRGLLLRVVLQSAFWAIL